jgi:transposase
MAAKPRNAGYGTIEIVERSPTRRRIVPKRWVVEGTFAWLSRFRRLARDFEPYAETARPLARSPARAGDARRNPSVATRLPVLPPFPKSPLSAVPPTAQPLSVGSFTRPPAR